MEQETDLVEQKENYNMDIVAALAERVIKRLWILVFVLILLLFGSNAAWIYDAFH